MHYGFYAWRFQNRDLRETRLPFVQNLAILICTCIYCRKTCILLLLMNSENLFLSHIQWLFYTYEFLKWVMKCVICLVHFILLLVAYALLWIPRMVTWKFDFFQCQIIKRISKRLCLFNLGVILNIFYWCGCFWISTNKKN